MKRTLATICLTVAVLLGITGCAKRSTNLTVLSRVVPLDYVTPADVAKRSTNPLNDITPADVQRYYSLAQGGNPDALSDLTRIAEWGKADARYKLGQIYQRGQGVPQDYKTAVRWYTLAAQLGFGNAQFKLGQMYVKGQGVPMDYKTALKWYRLAAEQGNVDAQSSLLSPELQVVIKESERLKERQRSLAEQGDADAQFQIGWLYANGLGVPQDYKTALKWYRLAAQQGDASAQYNLGFMYDKGKGVPQNYKTAVKWHSLAAEQGNADALSNLTVFAERGYADARFKLGQIYQRGQGVPQDYKTAVRWYTLAAQLGFGNAQFKLGQMYVKGQGVPMDYKTALKWYRLAAEQGNVDAQSSLLSPELQVVIKESERLERQRLADERQRLADIEAERLAVINAKMQKIISRLKPSCTAFGFKEGSIELSKCLFDLYKVEQIKEQNRTAAAQNRAAVEEQKKQHKSLIDTQNSNAASRDNLMRQQMLQRLLLR